MKLVAVACAGVVACGGGTHLSMPNTVDRFAVNAACARARSLVLPSGKARQNSFVGPTKPTAVWIREIAAGQVWGLTVDSDANAFIAMKAGVVALSRDGTVRWTHPGTVPPRTLPAVAADGSLYVDLHSDKDDPSLLEPDRGGVQRLDDCGEPIWMVHAPPQNPATPAIAPDGTLYFAGHDRRFDRPEQLYAVRGDGTIVWARPVDPGDSITTPIAIDDDGTIYYGTSKGLVKALTPDGALRWSTPIAPQVVESITAGDGRLYVTFSGALVAIDPHGQERWRRKVDAGAAPRATIGEDGTVYVGGWGLTAFAPDGTLRWQLDLERAWILAPIIARDGTLFVGAEQPHGVGSVYAVSPEGAVRFRYYLEPPTSLALAAERMLYVSAGSRVYALGECRQDTCEDDGSALPANGAPDSRPPRSAERQGGGGLARRSEPVARSVHEGYTIYPECRLSATAIVSTMGAAFSWLEAKSPVKAAAERERFRGQALKAAGPIRSHASGFGGGCVERGAFSIMVLPGEDVPAAAKRIGEWLVDAGLRGEVDLVVEPMPHSM